MNSVAKELGQMRKQSIFALYLEPASQALSLAVYCLKCLLG
jgi:hypothetical protein